MVFRTRMQIGNLTNDKIISLHLLKYVRRRRCGRRCRRRCRCRRRRGTIHVDGLKITRTFV